MSEEKRFNLPIPLGWYAVALTKDLEVGDVKPLRYFERDLVVFRTESGQAKVIDAFCPHLGAHLGHGGSVNGESIACPFHGWEFNGDGYCTDVPYAKNTPPRVDGKQVIPSYETIERNDAIWVWYHPQNQKPSFEIEEMEEFYDDGFTETHIREWVIKAPIQETGENAVDKAHFAYVHNALAVPEGTVDIVDHTRTTRLESETPAIGDDGELCTDGTTATMNLFTRSVGPGQTMQRFDGQFYTVMQGTVTPITSEETHIRFMFKQPKDAVGMAKIMADGVMAEISHQVEQDIPIWDFKTYQPNPILCDGDGPINQYRKWFSQFYAGSVDDSTKVA
jgi:phenylpropionate dioxygenase-like ring-hydroxylating dioxygenase large terminal subunit